MSEESFKRYRFSVPKADISVDNWIKAQSNLSYSLRELIKAHIREHGITDATCIPVECTRGPGRPSNAEQLARAAQAMQQAEAQPVPEVRTAPMQQPVRTEPIYEPQVQAPVSAPVPESAPVEQPRRQPSFVDPMDILNQS